MTMNMAGSLLRILIVSFILMSVSAHAQYNDVPGNTVPGVVPLVGCSLLGPCQGPIGANNPLPVVLSAPVSATISGFTPSAIGARMVPFSVGTSAVSGVLPNGSVAIVSDAGAYPMYCNVNGIQATIADQPILSNSWFAFTIPNGVTTLNCIAVGGSTTANGLGGSGIASGSGGGGGNSGGGGSVTQGTVPWVTSISGTPTVNQGTSPWTVSGNIGQGTSPWVVSGSVTSNQGTSPWAISGSVTQGTTPWAISGSVTQGTPPWSTVLFPSANAAIGITPAICGASSNGCVLKASPGNLYGIYANTSVSAYLMVFNSVSVPTNGSTTSGVASGNMVECIGPSTTLTISYTGVPPEVFSTGISAAVSTTGCGTLTLSASAFIHGYTQ